MTGPSSGSGLMVGSVLGNEGLWGEDSGLMKGSSLTWNSFLIAGSLLMGSSLLMLDSLFEGLSFFVPRSFLMPGSGGTASTTAGPRDTWGQIPPC